MSLSMIPAIKNKKLKNALPSRCNHASIPIFLLNHDTAQSDELMKK